MLAQPVSMARLHDALSAATPVETAMVCVILASLALVLFTLSRYALNKLRVPPNEAGGRPERPMANAWHAF